MRRRPDGSPRIPAWAKRILHPRWRDEILDDLVEEHRMRVEPALGPFWSAVWLRVQLVRAGAASRWHGWSMAAGGSGVSAPRRAGWLDMGGVIQDMRFAMRSLRRSPLVAAVALLTLGAGMGLTLAVFTVVDAVLLRPLDYPEPERLVLLQGPSDARHGVSMPAHELFRGASDLLDAAAAWQGWSPVLDGPDGTASRQLGASVSADFFDVVGVRPAAGRFFTAEDGMPGHEPVVVLGHGLWTRAFGADPGMVGRFLDLREGSYRVVGVAPAPFVDPVAASLGSSPRELWRAEPPEFRGATEQPGWVGFWSIGRLRAGARAADLTAEMRALLVAAYDTPEVEEYARGYRAVTVRDAVVEDVRPTLLVLFAAVIAVLLIACTNLANLLLSRATVRSRELAVRTSLGAGRGRLVRQLLTESAVLAGAGAAIGLVVSLAAVRVLVALAGDALPRSGEVALSGSVLVFTAAIALGTSLLFGLAPALRLSESGPAGAMRGGGRGGIGGGGGRRLRVGLVVVETAMAVVLLAGAGLLVGTLLRLQSVDPGFDTERVLVMEVGLGEHRFPEPPLQEATLRDLEGALAALPGVSAVGGITDLPLSGAVNSTAVSRAGESEEAARDRSNVLVRAVTPGYFEAMGIPMLAGRSTSLDDRPGAEEVAVVNAELVHRFFPSEDALGQVLRVRGVARRVVGVVADVREFDITRREADPVLYTPYAQEKEAWMRSGVSMVVRTVGDPAALGSPALAAVRSTHPGITLGALRPLSSWVEAQVRAPRFRATLILVFAGLALLLAAVGLGGVVAYGVAQRVPEIGLRLALGAERGQVQAMMLKETAAMTGAGVAIGLVLALLSGRVLAGFLYQVEPSDPFVLTGVATLLMVVGLGAGWLPARRAARIDPAATLRGD